jgi:hypothetical protein
MIHALCRFDALEKELLQKRYDRLARPRMPQKIVRETEEMEAGLREHRARGGREKTRFQAAKARVSELD